LKVPAITDIPRIAPTAAAPVMNVSLSELASTGIATDSARQKKANSWARWLAVPCRKLFQAAPMPELQMPRAKAPAQDLFQVIQ
jgi:hypothetical protein